MGHRGPLLACLLLLQAAAEAQAQVYRCEQNGKLAFSDQPCKPGAKASQKDYAPSGGGTGTLDVDIALDHYTVRGLDYASLARSLNANGPKGFHGLASWKIDYEYTARRQRDECRMDTVRVKVSGRILMPRWADEAAAPAELRRRWIAYYAALKQHEDGHVRHGRELALLVKERLLGLGAMPCDQVKAVSDGEFRRLSDNLKARDREYDARTNHGGTQGASF